MAVAPVRTQDQLAHYDDAFIGRDEMQLHLDYVGRIPQRHLEDHQLIQYAYSLDQRKPTDEAKIALAIQHNYAMRTGQPLPPGYGTPVTVGKRQQLDTIMALSTIPQMSAHQRLHFLQSTQDSFLPGRIIAAQIANMYMHQFFFGKHMDERVEEYIDTAHHLLYSKSARKRTLDSYVSVLHGAGLDHVLSKTI